MKKHLQNWNWMRLLRIVAGLLILGEGISNRDWIWILLGTIFALLPILNVGCGCTGKKCKAPLINKKKP